MRRFFIIVLMLGLTVTACGPSEKDVTSTKEAANAILTAAVQTASVELTKLGFVAPSETPQPTNTSEPTPTVIFTPTNIPYPTPQNATVRSNTNVRGIPSKSKVDYLGYLLKGQGVQVLARNDEATWLQVVFPDAEDDMGWVIIGAIKDNYDLTTLPIMVFPEGKDQPGYLIPAPRFEMVSPVLPPGTPAPGYPYYGTMKNDAYARIGPGSGFQTLQILDKDQLVTFTGKSQDEGWVQIDYPSGPAGRAWVARSQVEAINGYESLDEYNILGELVKEGKPVKIEPTNTLDPNATPVPDVTVSGTLTSQMNIRSGPGQSFDTLGTLDMNTVVTINGVNLDKDWYRFVYDGSTDGVAWVWAPYVSIEEDMMGLKVYDNSGNAFP